MPAMTVGIWVCQSCTRSLGSGARSCRGVNVEPQGARPGVANTCDHAGPWGSSVCPVPHGKDRGGGDFKHEDGWGRPDGFTHSSQGLG